MKKSLQKLNLLVFSFLLMCTLKPVDATAKIWATKAAADDCEISSLPFTEDFSLHSTFPNCWMSAGLSQATLNTTNFHQTPNSISLGGSSGNALLILPALATYVNINTLQVKYDLKPNHSDLILEIGIIVDPDDVTTFEALDRAYISSTEWSSQIAYLSGYMGEGHHIAFKVVNGFANNYIDNITIEEKSGCAPVRNLHIVSVGTNALHLAWQGDNNGNNDYVAKYKQSSAATWTNFPNTNQTELLLTNLISDERYTIQVTSNCSGTLSTFQQVEGRTRCMQATSKIVGTPDATTNTNGGVLPINVGYDYSYSQQIFKKEEVGTGSLSISGIAVQYFHNTKYTRNISVYLAQTSKSAFASKTDYIPLADLTHVFSGEVEFANEKQGNWVDILFTTPFSYDGTSNLVVTINDNTGVYILDMVSKFRTNYPAAGNVSLYFNSTAPIELSNPSTNAGNVVTSRNNMMFHAGCESNFCIAPSIVTTSNIMTTTADLTWVAEGNASGYDIEYTESSAATWTKATTLTGATTYTLSGLNPSTKYDVRVGTTCSGETNALWKTISFTTSALPCETVILPIEETFNTYAEGAVPLCWTSYTSAGNGIPSVTRNADNVLSAPGAMRFPATEQAYNYIALPELHSSVNVNHLQISFSSKRANVAQGVFLVGMMTDPNRPQTFQIIDTVRADAANIWQEHDILLSNYYSADKYIAFMWKDGNNSCFLEDIRIDYLTSCQRPSALTLDSVAAKSVYFSWVDNTINTRWKAVCIPAKDSLVWNNVFTFNMKEGIIDQLLPNTEYRLYLVADCGSEQSMETGVSFTTPCGIVEEDELPYTESFDRYGTTSTSFPTCWTLSSTTTPSINGSVYASSPGSLYFYYYSGAPIIVATEQFNMDVSELQLHFKLRGSRDNCGFVVGVMTDPTNSNTFTPVDTIFVETLDRWEDYTAYLSGYAYSGQYIAFSVGGFGSTYYNFYMDDLHITKTGACLAPDEVIVINVKSDEATITWKENGKATRWDVMCGYSGFDPNEGEGMISSSNANTTIISNLTANTLYDVYVRANCENGDVSAWSYLTASFFTAQMPASIPYECDFENAAQNEAWALFNGTQSNKWYIGESVAKEGSKSLYISGTNGSSNTYNNTVSFVYAAKSLAFVNAGNYDFEFDWRSNGDANYNLLRVFLVPTTVVLEAGNAHGMEGYGNTVPSGWIAIDGGALYGKSEWQHFATTETIYTMGTYNLVFFWKNYTAGGGQPPAAIDNVSVRLQRCAAPSIIVMSNPSHNTATVTWTSSAQSSEWEIQYGPTGFEAGKGTSIFVSPTFIYEIPDLAASSLYDVYIRAICGVNDTSKWSNKASFRTLCDGAITQLPYTENFDTYELGSPIPNTNQEIFPACWSVLKSGNATNAPCIANWDNANHSQSYSLDFGFAPSGYSMAILPEIDASILLTNVKISFWGKKRDNNTGTFQVVVLHDPTEPSYYTPVQSPITATTTYTQYTIDLSAYTGIGRYIALKWENANTGFFLDDLVIDYIAPIDPADTCTRPHTLKATYITENSAIMLWNAGDGETAWEIDYKLSSEMHYQNIHTVTTPTYTLSYLYNDRVHDVRVRAVCDETSKSKPVIVQFKTLAEGEVTYIITPSSDTNGTITPSEPVTVKEGESHIFAFTPKANYKVKQVLVNGVFVGNEDSYNIQNVHENMTIHVDFELIQSIPQHALNQHVVIYPNPAKEVLKVEMTTPFEKIEITNLLGQVIYTNSVSEQELTLNVSSYRSGIYFIRLYGKEGVVTKKFTVRGE